MTTRDDWESAAGRKCSKCGREAYRLVKGICLPCSGEEADEVQLLRAVVELGKELSDEDMKIVWEWNKEHQVFLESLQEIARAQHLTFNPKLHLKEWIIRRVAAGNFCFTPGRACPCPQPSAVRCPLLVPGK